VSARAVYSHWTPADKKALVEAIANGELGEWEDMADSVPTHTPNEVEAFVELLNEAAGACVQ
jgi:hypothetical protein